MIKVINRRKRGSLFHYAHFLCDCLFPEIINQLYLHGEVIREKSIHQTIGNFSKIYNEVMGTQNRELLKEEFDQISPHIQTLIYKTKEDYSTIDYFNRFRDFIFNRYNIPHNLPSNFPQILLIKRDDRIPLIDDPYLTSINMNITTGKERREIDQIDRLSAHLESTHGPNFRAIYLERISFEEQVRYFHGASLIICAHGAGMSNMFFCKSATTIFEVVCGREWEFFDVLSTILSLNHIKCHTNDINVIIPALNRLLKN
jgi:hypothetical protein